MTNIPQGFKRQEHIGGKREGVTANFDELFARMAADELADRLEQSPLMSPREYAKLRGNITPQNVYYYIRTGKLGTQYCNCGRKCINVVEADELFNELEKKRQGIPLEKTDEEERQA